MLQLAAFKAEAHRASALNATTPGLGLGLTIYNTDTNSLEYWDGNKWVGSFGSASNGLTMKNDSIKLGGSLEENTTIEMNNSNFNLLSTSATGKIGIGTNSPEAPLDVKIRTKISGNNTFQYVDGNQLAGRVLKSDAFGVASWQSENSLPATPRATFSTGVNFKPSDLAIGDGAINPAKWMDSKVRLAIPPGRWIIMVSILVRFQNPDPTVNGGMWLRSTFIREGNSEVISGDFDGTSLISGYVRTVNYQLLTGNVIINNTTNSSITYKYCVGQTASSGTWPSDIVTQSFGSSSAGENSIVGFALMQ